MAFSVIATRHDKNTGIESYDQMIVNLQRFPKVSLGFFPTPLVELPRLSKVLGGPKIFMKRNSIQSKKRGK